MVGLDLVSAASEVIVTIVQTVPDLLLPKSTGTGIIFMAFSADAVLLETEKSFDLPSTWPGGGLTLLVCSPWLMSFAFGSGAGSFLPLSGSVVESVRYTF